MKQQIKISAILAFVFFFSLIIAPKIQMQSMGETAGQKFKSIKVLNDMPADQMGKVMNMMSASLGVKCGFCHASDDGDYEKEGFEHKDIARQMLKMTFDLNKNYFEGKPEVNCNTCHQGQAHPRAVFPLTPSLANPGRPKQPEVKPDIFALIDKYLDATGRKELSNPPAMYIESTRLEPDGKTIEPESIWAKAGRVLTETRYGNYVVSEFFDGSRGMKFGNGAPIEIKPDEAEQIKREAQLLIGDFKSIYEKMDFRSLEIIEGKKVYRVDAVTNDGNSDRLYFDVDSGLLVRRASATPTVLGFHVFQVDYQDYKNFGSIKLPATVKYAMPQIYWTRKIQSVKRNIKIDEKKFQIKP